MKRGAPLLKVDPERPDEVLVRQAAAILQAGGLVAFPTETVYGLGANALDAEAVRRLFEAKGRPPRNPVIVHIHELAAVCDVVREWPEEAEVLAREFWPGPLTIVALKRETVPDVVTAGSDTVGVRVPAHPVALALLKAAACPTAAPSANPSGRVSPTTAQHVTKLLGDVIDVVVDGGPAWGGIESTVVMISEGQLQILRPGPIGAPELERASGLPVSFRERTGDTDTLLSPGQLSRHYAPSVPVFLTCHGEAKVKELLAKGVRTGWLHLAADATEPHTDLIEITMPQSPASYGAKLYAALHMLEEQQVASIVIDSPPDSPDWLSIRDRLRRAAAY